MTQALTYSLIILIGTWGAQKLVRPFLVGSRVALTVGLMGLLVLLTFQTANLFSIWASAGAPSAYLLPPYQSASYFASYAFATIWANYLISFAVGLLMLITMRYMNLKRKGVLFYSEEYPLALLCITLTGNPLWIVYAILTLVALTATLFTRAGRASTLPFWLPLAILTLLISPWLTKVLPLFLLRV